MRLQCPMFDVPATFAVVAACGLEAHAEYGAAGGMSNMRIVLYGLERLRRRYSGLIPAILISFATRSKSARKYCPNSCGLALAAGTRLCALKASFTSGS